MAKEKGYYAQAGLDVDIRAAMPGQEPMEDVINGHADFGVGTTDLLLMRDREIPVVVLAAIFQHSPLAMMARADSGILNVHQLGGKPLMIEPHSAELWAYFTKEGMDSDDIDYIDHTFDTRELLGGQVSAMSVYVTDEPFMLKQAGVGYHLLRPIASGIDFYGDNLFTLQSTIDNHPGRVQAFVDATLRGWRYAFEHVHETIDVILRDYPTAKSREHLLFEAQRTKELVLSDIVEAGYMNPDRWQRIAETYQELGLISPSLQLDGFLYDTGPKPLPAWVWQAIWGALFVALIGTAFTIYVIRTNRALRHKERQLVASNRHKEVLLAIIGHDLKNPIYAIRNYSDFLSNTDKNVSREELTQYGHLITAGVDSAMGVLDNLQQWAALQSEHIDKENTPVHLAPIIERNVELLRPQMARENIAVNVTGFENAWVMGNEWRIDTVVRNVLTNAYKACPNGGRIDIYAVSNVHGLDVVIEDTGPGMSTDNLAKFAEMESDVGNLAEKTGSGFGLPLCKRLIQINGGKMHLENRKDGGLRAIIRLPNSKTKSA